MQLRIAMTALRISIGICFLSGVADRFGLWTGRNVGYGNFAGFLRYTAKVNSFMPAFSVPFLGWSATVAESLLGILLVAGLWKRWAALAGAALLCSFGVAMAISFGVKSPLDYSVFTSAMACVVLGSATSKRKKTGAMMAEGANDKD